MPGAQVLPTSCSSVIVTEICVVKAPTFTTWQESGLDGDFGISKPGAFDDHQRCYACVVMHGNEYRCWYTGNGFGATGMGYAIGKFD